MMNVRILVGVFCLALSGAASVWAQGLRPSNQINFSRPAVTPSSEPTTADFIVAVVNSEPITNAEVRARLLRLEQRITQQGRALPERAELVQAVLDELINERAQLQMAREAGLKVDEASLDMAEQNVARENQVDLAEMRRQLAADGISPAQFRDDLRDQLLLVRLRDREVEPRVRVGEGEVDRFMRERRASASATGGEINLAQILVSLPDNPSDAQVSERLARAQMVLERLRGGADFAQTAREFSDANAAASNAGVMGLRPVDRYPALFIEATRSVREGGLSNILRSGAGFHILLVVERRAGDASLTTVAQTRARHILLRPGPGLGEWAARERLMQFRQRIEAGQASFDQLAREHSQDGSAFNGGDLGWANPGTYVGEFERALERLRPGQVSEPVATRFGVHLIQLLDRREVTLSEREQREIARNQLREKKYEEALGQWARDIRARAYVVLREEPRL